MFKLTHRRFLLATTSWRVLAATMLLAGCTQQQVSAVTGAATTLLQGATMVLVDAAACQADMPAIKGQTVAKALQVAKDPNCTQALLQALAVGGSAATVAATP
jgi:hypothetical protein